MGAQTLRGDEFVRDISPNDATFEGDAESYFAAGRSARDGVALALRAAGKSAGDIDRILDLPCGHGRVLRHLRAAYPEATVVACDADRDGVDYCAATFGAVPVYSEGDPLRAAVEPGSFDLVWAGSLLAHTDADRWAAALGFFQACLRPGGVLVLSARGRLPHHRLASGLVDYGLPAPDRALVLRSYDRTGFGYAGYPSGRGHGFSLAHPSWVLGELTRHGELRLVHYAEAAWSDHHDLVAAVRDPGWRNGPSAASAAAAGTATPTPAAPRAVTPEYLDAIEPARGYIDSVESTDQVVAVTGWMIHPEEPVTHLRLYLNSELVGEGRIGDRPDVAKVFPSIPHAAKSGVDVRLPQTRWAGVRAGRADLVGVRDGRPVARMSTPYRTDLDDAVPTPPENLMHRVTGTRHGRFFKVWGLKCYGDFLEFFRRHGRPGRGDRLLDWGCGCGRLSAHFLQDPDGPEVYGCDVDAEAVAWCNRDLRAGRFHTVPPHPPAPYADGRFSHAVGYSVLTHLTREVQRAWLAELRRVLAPGGLLVVTVHGESATSFSFPGRAAEVLRDGIYDGVQDAVLDGIVPPGYYRATFQSEEYTRREWGKLFEVLEYKVRGIGNHQDAVVLRRPA